MTLQIIGSGFGRTGTMSLKNALEILGYGPCHHMDEVFANPPQVAYWQAFAAGEPVDWNEVFAGYRAQVDWPGAHVWRELAAAFPAARVIHTERPADKWHDSFSQTIGKLIAIRNELPMPPHIAAMVEVGAQLIGQETFAGRLDDRAHLIATYRRRGEEVRAAIPADRLLVYDIADGWGPLCAFLGVPVPEAPFPHRNNGVDFWKLMGPPG